MAALSGLIHLKQKTTENKIKEKLLSDEVVQKNLQEKADFNYFMGANKKENLSFKGAASVLANFMYNPVWNMSILDGAISGTRLVKARKGERGEVLFKEASVISFFYILAGPIQKGLEKLSEKLFKKPINLDYKVLADDEFVKTVKDGSLKNAIKDFKTTNKQGVEVLDYIWENQGNALVETLKKSGVVPTRENPSFFKKLINGKNLKNAAESKIDALKYMDPEEILSQIDIIENFVNKMPVQDIKKHMKTTKALKIASIFGNIAISVLFLGIIQPMLAIKRRELKGGDKENPAIKEAEQKAKIELKLK